MRNLKALGLALVAIFALGAIAASAASANQFHSSGSPTQLTVASSQQQLFTYESGGEELTCPSVGGEGEISGAQTTTNVQFFPTYPTTCKAVNLGAEVHVLMNECWYTFTIEASANNGPVHIVCPTGKKITLTVTLFGSSFCTFHIGPQTPGGQVDYANEGASQVKVQSTVTGIAGERQGSSLCGKATSTTGTYTGPVVVKGHVPGKPEETLNVQVG